MNEPANRGPDDRARFDQVVRAKVARKLDARTSKLRVVPFGLGTMGLIGWSVSVPTLVGTALGIWLDRHYPGRHSWTLALLVAGLALGCWSAWRWVAREVTEMQGDEPDNHD